MVRNGAEWSLMRGHIVPFCGECGDGSVSFDGREVHLAACVPERSPEVRLTKWRVEPIHMPAFPLTSRLTRRSAAAARGRRGRC